MLQPCHNSIRLSHAWQLHFSQAVLLLSPRKAAPRLQHAARCYSLARWNHCLKNQALLLPQKPERDRDTRQRLICRSLKQQGRSLAAAPVFSRASSRQFYSVKLRILHGRLRETERPRTVVVKNSTQRRTGQKFAKNSPLNV